MIPESIDQQGLDQGLIRPTELLVPENLERRVDSAVETCDFMPNPELRQGMEGFYQTHYTLAETIEFSLSGNPSELESEEVESRKQSLQTIIDDSISDNKQLSQLLDVLVSHGNLHSKTLAQNTLPLLAALQLARLDQPEDPALQRAEIQLLVESCRSLFAESSVAVTTLSNEDKTLLASLRERTAQKARESEHFFEQGSYLVPRDLSKSRIDRPLDLRLLDDPLYDVNKAERVFWDDIRYAGQLLFHNSSNYDKLRYSGRLMPRRMQKHLNGDIYAANAEQLDGHHHAPTVHWSEDYDPVTYRGPQGTENAGTVALPLWKIIEVAPFGRDAQYGGVRIKPDRLEEVKEKIHISDGMASIGAGSSDYQGKGGSDRTFYSSPRDADPTAPIETAPDGHLFELDKHAFAVTLGKKESNRAQRYGLGEGFPSVYPLVENDEWSFHDNPGAGLSREERSEMIAEQIKELQHASIARNPDHIIIPIRAGIFDFMVPDDGRAPKPRARFTRI